MPSAHRFLAPILALAIASCSRAAPEPAPEPAPAPAASTEPMTTPSPLAVRASGDTSRATLVREYRGSYMSGFEISWFESCDAPRDDRPWWVTLTDDALRQRDSLLSRITDRPADGLAVVWRATISPRMRAGHTGRGTRYMLVTEIISLRPMPAGGACTGRPA
jgi:hypothetical protein